jgi:hypothetical protein
VTARAVGAWLVAMIAIGYLFGSFDGGRDFLFAVLVSAAFAALVELWLRRGERRDAVAPGDFDEKATKRAVRRGVVRTAFVAVVWVILGLTVVSVVSAAWQTRGDRGEHFADVVGYGFVAARPGFGTHGPAGCCNTDLRSLEAWQSVDPKTAGPLEQSVELRFELDLRGRLGDEVFSDLPPTGVDAALAAFDPEGESRLGELPDGVVATAVGELRRPLDVASFYRLLQRRGIGDFDSENVAVYVQPYERTEADMTGTWYDERVSWPNPALAGFQAWVKTLRSSDDEVLDRLGLPPVRDLEQIAAAPQIYGFVLDQASPARLRSLAADPAVEWVTVGDVAFNLSAAGS